MEKEDGFLTKVKDRDIQLLNTNPDKFWEGVTKIGHYAFSDCTGLEKINIPAGVTEIEDAAFSGCSGLTEINVANDNNFYSSDDGVLYNKEKTKLISCPIVREKINIPPSVKEIGRFAFLDLYKLTEINVSRDNNFYSSADGVLYNKEKTKIIRCPIVKEKINIPLSVKEIGENAFRDCYKLTEINIPAGVTEIGDNAFSGCKELTELNIPAGVTKIGWCTFSGCSGLTKINIPAGVTEIEMLVFGYCYKLTEIHIPAGVVKIDKSAFSGCDKTIIYYKNLKFPAKLLGENFNILKDITDEKEMRFVQECFDANFNYFTFTDREKAGNKELNWKPWKTLLKNFDLSKTNEANTKDLFVFARAIGLFDKDESMQVNGTNNKVKVSDIAFNFLQKFIKDIPLEKMHMFLQGAQNNGICKEFLQFVGNKANYQDIISQMKKETQESFLINVYNWFVERRELQLDAIEREDNTTHLPTSEENRFKIRTYFTTESGIDKTRWKNPTVELLLKEFTTNKFTGITSERNRTIAEHFVNIADYSQKHFDKAKEIDKEREESEVPDFIVGKKISQNTTQAYMEYLSYVGDIEKDIVTDAKEIIENQKDVSNKIFTYEALAKSDIANFSIGYMTSCCARLYDAGAGAMRGAIIDPDMQPLVVRDNKGDIVAYSILYINRENGYAVLNDIEVNRKYEGDKESLKIIYEKMRRNAIENIEVYNENTEKKIEFINSGISLNWEGVNNYIMKNPKSTIMQAPNFDNYKYAGSGSWSGDWHKSQYTIWSRNEIEEGRDEK